MGLVVLTDQRLFFFEKSLATETIEEFPLRSVSSMETGKKRTGERLVIHASGNHAEITQMTHGQADEITRRFRALARQRDPGAPLGSAAAPAGGADAVLAQIEQLASLRDRGVITDAEFADKKAELLRRL